MGCRNCLDLTYTLHTLDVTYRFHMPFPYFRASRTHIIWSVRILCNHFPHASFTIRFLMSYVCRLLALNFSDPRRTHLRVCGSTRPLSLAVFKSLRMYQSYSFTRTHTHTHTHTHKHTRTYIHTYVRMPLVYLPPYLYVAYIHLHSTY
jgi:hypothetical protein